MVKATDTSKEETVVNAKGAEIMNQEQLKMEMENIKKQDNELATQINNLMQKKRKLEARYEECQKEMERYQFRGMTQDEYFKSIAGTEFKDDGYKIKIGGIWDGFLSVSILEDGREFTISSPYYEKGGTLLIQRLEANGRIKTSKKYDGYQVAGSCHEEIYNKLAKVKNKYGLMMGKAEIEPLTALDS